MIYKNSVSAQSVKASPAEHFRNISTRLVVISCCDRKAGRLDDNCSCSTRQECCWVNQKRFPLSNVNTIKLLLLQGLNIEEANTRPASLMLYFTLLDFKGTQCKIYIMSLSGTFINAHYRLSVVRSFPSLRLHIFMWSYAHLKLITRIDKCCDIEVPIHQCIFVCR